MKRTTPRGFTAPLLVLGGVVADKIGYGKLVILAFVTHMLSAVVTFGASSPDNAYTFLFWGMFLFAYANGTLEAVANPLVATLFPEKRTHYLNILQFGQFYKSLLASKQNIWTPTYNAQLKHGAATHLR